MKVLAYQILFIFLFSCTNLTDGNNRFLNNNEDTSCNNLDICINGQIYFIDGNSIRNSFPNIKSAWKMNDRVYFVTKDSLIYISLGFNYGGGQDEYKEAEIGYVEGAISTFVPIEVLNSSFNPNDNYLEPKFYFTTSRFKDFETESGIKLGISEEELLNIAKKKNWVLNRSQTDSVTIYKYENDYCMYEAKYIFKDKKLNQFSFGFITP